MTSKNRIKIYVPNSYYHIYNRGVNKQEIFFDKSDYRIFITYIKDALSEPVTKLVTVDFKGRSFEATPYKVKNFQKEISILAYCLMPNHFHLLVKQNNKRSIESFMRSILTRYVQYVNKKYNRVGPLFQGRYKAALVTSDEYLLHLSRYIHLNPQELNSNIIDTYSSYSTYLGIDSVKWVDTNPVLKFFNRNLTYKSFVESKDLLSTSLPKKLIFD